jgi:hypothetical protein
LLRTLATVDAPMQLGTFGVWGTVASPVPDPKPGDTSLLINVTVKNSAPPATPGVLSGPIYLRDSFGFDLFGNQTCWCRLDPAGLVVFLLTSEATPAPSAARRTRNTPRPRQGNRPDLRGPLEGISRDRAP